KELLETYRAQAQGLQAGGGGKFGVDMFVNIVPSNPIRAAASLDMLGIIFFSLVFGAALTMLPEEKTQPMVRVLDALGEAIVKIIDFAMRLAPYGVFGLIFVVTSRFGFALLLKLGLYVAVVLVGLLIHGAISISALVRVFGGLSPRVFFSRIRASIITGFSTSSSNATLPTNIAVAERELKIPPKIAGFVLPLGSTMCMNGTALFEGVTVLFLAQVFGVPLTLSQQVVVMILSVITAVVDGGAGRRERRATDDRDDHRCGPNPGHGSDHDQRRGRHERGGLRGPNGKRVGPALAERGRQASCLIPPPVSAPPLPNRSCRAQGAPA